MPSLSPSYLELIREAAREIEVHLYLLNPCREYWGDIHSRREIDYRADGADPDARYLTEGNELLAAWGRAGRDTIDTLVEVQGAEWEEHFVEPAGPRRLAAVQRDILDLRLAREAVRTDGEPDGGIRDRVTGSGGKSAPKSMDSRLRGNDGDNACPSFPRRRESMAPEPNTDADGVPGGVPEGAPASPCAGGSGAAGPAPDDSIQIHVCHSPVREAEVLHDRLLAAFDAHPDLEPADVLVLAPDLDVYGPAVEAVFASGGRIPCHVARARTVESRTMRAFLDLLSLPRSRQGAETVLAPLAAPAIQARFGFGDADVATIREWVREAGIRWGVDEAHRGEEGLPATADHTWRHGLRRLLLGYAMADAGAPVAGLVPCRAGEAAFDAGETDGELLGRFVSYCEGVLGLRHRLAGRRRPAHWAAELRALVRDFLADGSEPVERGAPIRRTGGPAGGALARELADEVGAVRALIRELENEASAGESPVPVEVVVDVLRERAQGTAREAARLAHGVTVASLGAGRIFPAGVVCVVGMNDGVFPRSPSAPSFDVVAAGRARRGDRDVRYEDRFAFLEALLAARRCFIVTHAGRGLRDDAPIPPSVLVDELKDYLARRFPGEPAEIRHPLQPFSPRYFEPAIVARHPAVAEGTSGRFADAGRLLPLFPRRRESTRAEAAGEVPYKTTGDTHLGTQDLFSYSHGMCEAANVLRAARTAELEPQSRFAGVELPEPDESRRCVDLADLARFFANPTRYFLRERLGVRLELEDLALEDEEPFELDGLERHRLHSDVWSQVQAGVEPERGAALLHGSGRLPQAGLGRIVHEDAREEVEPLEALLAPYRGALRAPPRSVDLALGGFRITGAIEHVGPDDGAPGAHDSCEPGSGAPGPRTMSGGGWEGCGPGIGSRSGCGSLRGWRRDTARWRRWSSRETASRGARRRSLPPKMCASTSGGGSTHGGGGSRRRRGSSPRPRSRTRTRLSAPGVAATLSWRRPATRRSPPGSATSSHGASAAIPTSRWSTSPEIRWPATSRISRSSSSFRSQGRSREPWRSRLPGFPASLHDPGWTTAMNTGSAPEAPLSDHTPVDFPLDRAGTTFIEASAGTGKTHALTTLVARLVIEEGWPIDRILVVTFTRAATAELRDRIRRVLGMLLDAVRARLREAAPPAGRIRDRSTSLRRNSAANSLDSRLRGNDEQALAPSFPRRRESTGSNPDTDAAGPEPPAGPPDSTGPPDREAREPAVDPRARELLAAWEDRAGDIDFALAARRLEGAMHDIDRANVFTIHGFCQRVLADLAFESGLSFECEVGGEGGEAVAAAVRDFWRRRMYPSSPLLMRHAVENGFLPRALAGWTSRRRAKIGAEVVGGDPPAQPLEACEATWRGVYDAVRSQWEAERDTFRTEILEGPWLNRQRYRTARSKADLAALDASFSAAEPRLPAEDAAGRYGREQLSRACKRGFAVPDNPLFDALDRLEDASAALRTVYDQWLRWARREALAEVRQSVRRRVRTDRILAWDDLPIELDHALGSAGGERLAARIRREFPCALIDEYQDTDPVQARIFSRIYADPARSPRAAAAFEPENEEGASARGGRTRPGPFIVVGDPKQSIYRFRGADVFAYLAARRSATGRLHLDRNWRSVPPLVEAVNAVFSCAVPFVTAGSGTARWPRPGSRPVPCGSRIGAHPSRSNSGSCPASTTAGRSPRRMCSRSWPGRRRTRSPGCWS